MWDDVRVDAVVGAHQLSDQRNCESTAALPPQLQSMECVLPDNTHTHTHINAEAYSTPL